MEVIEDNQEQGYAVVVTLQRPWRPKRVTWLQNATKMSHMPVVGGPAH